MESTGITLIQVQRALKRLEGIGLISKTKSGNRIYYTANKNHPAFEDLKRVLIKTVLFGDLLKKALVPYLDKIHFVFIYGSLASGNETASSDIDLFIIGDLGLRDVASVLSEIQQTLRREINPTVYPEVEFRRKLKEQNPFIKEVLSQPKLWLIGDENEFAKMD